MTTMSRGAHGGGLLLHDARRKGTLHRRREVVVDRGGPLALLAHEEFLTDRGVQGDVDRLLGLRRPPLLLGPVLGVR